MAGSDSDASGDDLLDRFRAAVEASRRQPWGHIEEAIWATGRNYAAALPEMATTRGTQVFTGAMVAVEVEDPEWVPVGGDVGDVGLPRVVRVERWTDTDGPAVVVVVDSSDGTPRIQSATHNWPPSATLRKLGLLRLLDLGVAFVARSGQGPLNYRRPEADPNSPFSMPVPDAMREVRRARRAVIDDDTLARTAKAWLSTTGAGRIVAVMDEFGFQGERQARRYVSLAQEKGLIPRERKRPTSKKAATKTKAED